MGVTSRHPLCSTKTAQVATSKMGSRHQLPWGSQNRVATSNRCRNITQANPGRDTKTRSRHQNQVATLLEATLCRDITFMSRPRFCPVGFPGRDTNFQVATSHTATHVATSNQFSPISATSRCHFSLSRPPLLTLMSRLQN